VFGVVRNASTTVCAASRVGAEPCLTAQLSERRVASDTTGPGCVAATLVASSRSNSMLYGSNSSR